MPRHNKQHDARAASFRRIAKELRAQARLSKDNCEAPVVGQILKRIASAHDGEAKTLRALR
jgi:hypothetical protein